MFSAFVRLVQIAISVLLVFFLAVLAVRHLAESERHAPPFEEGIFQAPKWVIAMAAQTKVELVEDLNRTPQKIIFGAKIERLADGSIVVAPGKFLIQNGKQLFLGQVDLGVWRKLNPMGLLLEDFLNLTGERPVYLQMSRMTRYDHKALTDALTKLPSKKEILIQSVNQSLKGALKETSPRWIFGNTIAELGKIQIFTSLGLGPLVNSDADFYVLQKRNDGIENELKRRYRKVLVESNDFSLLRDSALDGIIVTLRPEFWPTDLVESLQN